MLSISSAPPLLPPPDILVVLHGTAVLPTVAVIVAAFVTIAIRLLAIWRNCQLPRVSDGACER